MCSWKILPWILFAALLIGACQPTSAQPELRPPAGGEHEMPATGLPSGGNAAVVRPAPATATYPARVAQSASPGLAEATPTTAPSHGAAAGQASVDEPPSPTPGKTEMPRLYFPDSEIVYGPSALDFDTAAYLKQAGGYLSAYREYLASTGWTSAAAIIERVALENSINPRLLVALLEYQCGCVQSANPGDLASGYALGVLDFHRKGLYGQLWWASNQLSVGFYGAREGWLPEITLPDGSSIESQPGSNPGSLAIEVYFSRLWIAQDLTAKMGAQAWAALHPNAFNEQAWRHALDAQRGFPAFYQVMFSDTAARAAQVEPLVPPNLRQPDLVLPFEPGRLWSFTSGPHKAWESEGSQAALDFAPASDETGCLPSRAWVTAVGDGQLVRSGPGIVVQDLDGSGADGGVPSDGREQTGWAILYMHIASQDMAPVGAYLRAGQRIGRPSCEGGPATGTHLHIARKYNGVWIAAGGEIPFVLDGWTVQNGEKPYAGQMIKDGRVITANPYATSISHISRPQSEPLLEPSEQQDTGIDEP